MVRVFRIWPPLVVCLFAVAVTSIGFYAWAKLKPNIRLASLAQLKAVVPQELVVEAPRDKAAEARFEEFVKIAKTLNSKDDGTLTMNWADLASVYEGSAREGKVSKAEQQALVVRIWRAHPHLMSDLEVCLNSGPMAFPPEAIEKPGDYLPIIDATRLLVFSADSYAAYGEFKPAAKMIALSYKMADRLIAARARLTDYFTSVLVAGLTTAATEVFSKPDFPAADCAMILAAAKPAPKRDEYGAMAIQAEFVSDVLPDLTKDLPRETGAGSYDAIETAKAKAKEVLIAISNLRRPFSWIDNSYSNQLVKDANDVLGELDPVNYNGPYKGLDLCNMRSEILEKVKPNTPPTADTAILRLNLNRIHNSLGRLNQFDAYDMLPRISCDWRVTRDLTRVLLASRIYRAAHGGKLPDSPSGFVPILGAWPTNPFDGKPLIYLPKREVVYGVREDLTDHGGDIGTGYPNGKDAGISLKLSN